MKLSVFLFLLGIVQVFANNSYAQKTKLSVNLENASIEKALLEIENTSSFKFIYNKENVDVESQVSIHLSDKSIQEILDVLFEGQKVGYVFYGNQVILTKTSFENDQIIRSISGRVTDTSGSPLPGVTVVVKGTTQGTITDNDGNYLLSGVSGDATLVFSFVGMRTQEVEVGNQTNINVRMEEDTIGLEEVVAIGYGTEKKINLTGSVSTVDSETLNATSSVNISNSLAGKLPGLVAVARSGEPGRDDVTLRIRGLNTLGNNSPLYVVDGIVGRSIERLNPEDIESISVLKDASGAIYGAQAANGVILVTTKRGTVGKAESKININFGWGKPTNIPEMADAATWGEYVNEIFYYRGQSPQFSDDEIQKYRDGSDPWGYPNTDWFDETFRNFAPERHIDYSVNGGTNLVKYFVSLGSKFQDAIYKNSGTDYSQTNFRSNLDLTLSKDISISFDLSGRQENRNFGRYTGSTLYHHLMLAYPYIPAFYPNGLPGPDIIDGINPAIIAQEDVAGYRNRKQYVMESNIGFNINIPWVEGLSITSNVAIDKYFQNNKDWLVPWYLYSWDGETYDENNEPVLEKGQKGVTDPRLTQSMGDDQRTTMNLLFNYEHSFSKDHNIKVLVGTERLTGERMNFNAFRRYFLSTEIDQMFAGGNAEKDNGGSASESARLNYFSRLNYDYKGKYLAEFVWRYDGSYIFPEDNRFGFFPGISFGWRISEESFWENSFPVINYFKLRGSWGQTGNDRIEEYQYMSTYAFSSVYTFNEQTEVKTLKENRIPNPNVTWEVANQSNLGFDAQLFDNKLSFSGEVFYNIRSNILWWRNASVPHYSGLTLPRENIGEVENRGLEVQIGYYNNMSSDFKYSISINGAYQKNKIKFWDETPGVPDYQKSTGYPMNSRLYYEAIGIFKDQAAVDAYPHWEDARPGDVIFKDVNEDGKIDGLDRVRHYKNDIPRFTGGMNIDLEFKNFYSNLLINGASGAVLNTFIQWTGLVGNGFLSDMEGRWTEDNIDATKARARNQLNEYWASQPNTYWLKNTDYIRLKNLEIGYKIPNAKMLLGMNDLRIYVSGRNLATLTKLINHDPEANSTNSYPPHKTYNVGLTLTF